MTFIIFIFMQNETDNTNIKVRFLFSNGSEEMVIIKQIKVEYNDGRFFIQHMVI